MIEVAIILSGMAVCFTLITGVFSVLAYAKVIGMEKSTHRIVNQMVPMGGEMGEDDYGPTGPDLVEKMKKAFYPDDEEPV